MQKNSVSLVVLVFEKQHKTGIFESFCEKWCCAVLLYYKLTAANKLLMKSKTANTCAVFEICCTDNVGLCQIHTKKSLLLSLLFLVIALHISLISLTGLQQL